MNLYRDSRTNSYNLLIRGEILPSFEHISDPMRFYDDNTRKAMLVRTNVIYDDTLFSFDIEGNFHYLMLGHNDIWYPDSNRYTNDQFIEIMLDLISRFDDSLGSSLELVSDNVDVDLGNISGKWSISFLIDGSLRYSFELEEDFLMVSLS